MGVLLAYAASNPPSQPCVIPLRSRFCSRTLPVPDFASVPSPLTPYYSWRLRSSKRNRPMYMDQCISSYLFAGAGKANSSGCSEEGPPSPDRNEMNSPASTLLDSDTSCSIPAAQPSPASDCAVESPSPTTPSLSPTVPFTVDEGAEDARPLSSVLGPVLQTMTPVRNDGDGDCFWCALEQIIDVGKSEAQRRVSAWLRQQKHRPASLPLKSHFTTEWEVDAAVQALQTYLLSGLVVCHMPLDLFVVYRPLRSPLLLFDCADLPPGAPFFLYTEGACAGEPGHFELMLATVSDASSVSAGSSSRKLPAPRSAPSRGDSVDGACQSDLCCPDTGLSPEESEPGRSNSLLPSMRGGMSPNTPAPTQSSGMLDTLLDMGVPVPLARQACIQFSDDLNAALDWICSSERRHTRPAVDNLAGNAVPIEIVDEEPDPPRRPSLLPPVPFSWREPSAAHIEASVASVPPQATPAASSASYALVVASPENSTAASPMIIPRPLSIPCFLSDPQGEVEYYVAALANSAGAAAVDIGFWQAMPMYSQYIIGHSCEEVVCHSVSALKDLRSQRLTVEEAAKLPHVLGYTTLLPVAVACEFLHVGCGMPAIFVFDLFQACLASCQHKSLAIATYADRSTTFSCKARWWACPTGDPNAGKSPACSQISNAFAQLVQEMRQYFYPIDHFVGVGNNGKIQERLRKLDGVLLLWGAEAKPMLDPSFPTKESVDVGKYLDFTRWLEAANGGKFEWGTGTEEKAFLNTSRQTPAMPPLTFPTTNINLCLFQQFALFRSWWVKAEQKQQCGFTARVLLSPTGRAIIDRDMGLQDATVVEPLFRHLWAKTVTAWGPTIHPHEQLTTSTVAQHATRQYYYSIHELEEEGGWGSAGRAALGKMEYHVPSSACLTALQHFALCSEAAGYEIPDNALKCAIRHFDLRVVCSNNMVDSEIARQATRSASGTRRALSPAPVRAARSLETRLLTSCTKDPITSTDVGKAISSLRGAAHTDSRLTLLHKLAELGLGQIREGRRFADGTRSVEFCRFPMSSHVGSVLDDLFVSHTLWKPQSLPPMQGAGGKGKGKQGKKGRGKAAVVGGDEGQAEDAVAERKAGRPLKAATEARYSQKATLELEVAFADQAAFLAHEKAWAKTLVEGQCLAIRHNFQPHAAGFKASLWCNSCDVCQKQQGWKGISTYNVGSKTLYRAYTPITSHGDFQASKSWNPLTSTCEDALKQFVSNTKRFTTQDLVKIVEAKQHTRPSDEFLKIWGKNHRQKNEGGHRSSSFNWVEADWRQLERDLGGIDGLEDCPDALKFVAASYEPTATVVVFCNPALLRETLTRLTNLSYIKLCGDGTFRLTHGEWVLLTIGTLTKHYASSSSVYAFRTTFNPLMFALANKESQPTYQFFFQHVVACGLQFAGVDLSLACRQYHADLHSGEDAALKAIFVNADRVADWAHVMGACQRSKPPAQGLNPVLQARLIAYRTGVLATMKKALTAAGQPIIAVIERAFHCMRSIPTALLFHSLADLLMQTLTCQNPPERAAATKLQQWYFKKMPARDAKARFHLKDWPGDNRHLLVADWWCGLERTQPGSASGTQAQESWHKCKLKNYLGLRSSLPTLMTNLASFTSSRMADLPDSLPDVPLEPFPDKVVLHDGRHLTREGRTSAHQFYRTGAYDVWDDEEGSLFFCVPRTLATWDPEKTEWIFTPDENVQKPEAGRAKALAGLLLAKEVSALTMGLNSLGLGANPLQDLDKCLHVLNRCVLVVVGPRATEYWRRAPPAAEREPNHHIQGLCGFCQTFCLHGTCEHLHTAFLHLQHISLRSPQFPDRGRRAPPFEQDPVQLLLPAEGSQPMHSNLPQTLPTPSSSDAGLKRFLQAGQFQLWEAPIQKQCFSIQQLASLPLSDLVLALPTVPAGILSRIQTSAVEWLKKQDCPCSCTHVLPLGFIRLVWCRMSIQHREVLRQGHETWSRGCSCCLIACCMR